ncbi:hypothetical protein DY000_02044711 [Brassica cretica]|uniref:RNase H type-1 domain-containing protein n=1 Tax=Brassica cretica TaxID=69181 RepID=A0ABQ7EV65_BRACR|nr:hypothetical protein DY000_02044711 [Brassica cretica]
MKDLGYQEVVLGSDLHELIEAMMKPLNRPRYRIILHRINVLCSSFVLVAFETESTKSNKIAREIEKSVLRGGWFHSYLALRGPAWLHVKARLSLLILVHFVACPSQLPKEEILPYLPLWNISKSSSKSFGNLPLMIYIFSKVNHSLLSFQVVFTSALSRYQFQSSSQLHSFTSASLHVALLVLLHVVLHDWYMDTLRSCFSSAYKTQSSLH